MVGATQGSEITGAGCAAVAIGFPRFGVVGVAAVGSAGTEREDARVVRELDMLANASGRLIRTGVDRFLEVEHWAGIDRRRESSRPRGTGEPFADRSWVAADRLRISVAFYYRDPAGRISRRIAGRTAGRTGRRRRNGRVGKVNEELHAGRACTFAVPERTR